MQSADIRGAFDGSVLYKQAEERQRRTDNSKKQTGITSSSGARAGSSVSNPVKLAVALVTGIAVLIWAFPNVIRNSPGWASSWWDKDTARTKVGELGELGELRAIWNSVRDTVASRIPRRRLWQ